MTDWKIQYGTRNYKNKILNHLKCFVHPLPRLCPADTRSQSLLGFALHYDMKATLQLLGDLVSLKCPWPLEQASGLCACRGAGGDPESVGSEPETSESKPKMMLMEWGKSLQLFICRQMPSAFWRISSMSSFIESSLMCLRISLKP